MIYPSKETTVSKIGGIKKKKCFIVSAKCDVSGGIACGPIATVVGEVKYNDEEGKTSYMSLAEIDGIAEIYTTPHSTFKYQMELDLDEEWYDVFRYLLYIVRSD